MKKQKTLSKEQLRLVKGGESGSFPPPRKTTAS